MEEETLAHAFEPFTGPIHPARKDSWSRPGPSIVKHILDQIHGKIEIESQKGKGTTVTVILTNLSAIGIAEPDSSFMNRN